MVFSQMLSCSFPNIFKAFWFIVCLLLIVIPLGHLACSSVRIHLNWTNPNCQHFSQSVEAAHAAARIAASWNCLARDRCKEVQPQWILCQTEKASSSTILEHLVHCSSAYVQFYDLGDIFFSLITDWLRLFNSILNSDSNYLLFFWAIGPSKLNKFNLGELEHRIAFSTNLARLSICLSPKLLALALCLTGLMQQEPWSTTWSLVSWFHMYDCNGLTWWVKGWAHSQSWLAGDLLRHNRRTFVLDCRNFVQDWLSLTWSSGSDAWPSLEDGEKRQTNCWLPSLTICQSRIALHS